MPMFFQSVRHASSVEGYENLGGTYLRPPASMHNERTSKTLFIRRHIRMIISAIGHSLLVRSCPSLYHMCQCPLGFVVDAKSFSNFFICSLYGQPAQSGRSPWVRCEVPGAAECAALSAALFAAVFFSRRDAEARRPSSQSADTPACSSQILFSSSTLGEFCPLSYFAYCTLFTPIEAANEACDSGPLSSLNLSENALIIFCSKNAEPH